MSLRDGMGVLFVAPVMSNDEPIYRSPAFAHVAPFIAWLFLMQMLGDPAGWKYAARSAACLGLFLFLRPWQWYPRFSLKNLPIAVAVGVGVFVAWVIGEAAWTVNHAPAVHEAYVKWGVMPFGALREPVTSLPYDPAVCGWALSIVRILGSAFVIAPIEEFFWRGFAYRWAMGGNFLEQDAGRFVFFPFALVALVFGFEHAEWLAGIVAGIAYGWLYLKTRDIWAASIAHIVTNLLLGIYVLATGSYQFW